MNSKQLEDKIIKALVVLASKLKFKGLVKEYDLQKIITKINTRHILDIITIKSSIDTPKN